VALDEKLGIEIRNRIMENQYDEITSFLYKKTKKNPNLENRIVKNISNHSFFGTKQNIMKIFVQHICI
jgi:hypothetical protein